MIEDKAIKAFVNSWKIKPEVIGILLTGSYVVGLQNKDSDVDIRIVLREEEHSVYSYKGVEEINGLSFSFMARTKRNILKKMNNEYFNVSKFEARLFHIGEVLYEEGGCIDRIKSIARFYYNQPKRMKIASVDDEKIKQYSLKSRFSYLMQTDAESPFFLLNYYLFMKVALIINAEHWNVETFVLDTKLEKVLTDDVYKEKYDLEEYPDKEFLDLWLNSLKKENISHEYLILVYNYFKKITIFKHHSNSFISKWEEA